MRTANPAMNAAAFQNAGTLDYAGAPSTTMTVEGAATKTLILLGLLTGAAAFTWSQMGAANPQAVLPWVIGGVIGGAILAIATIFKPAWSPVTTPIYALCEGVFLGGVSALVNARYPGIAFQAVTLTIGTLFVMLIGYQTGVLRATAKFRMGVTAATGGIALLYVTSFVLSFFGMGIPYIHEAGWIGIGFSLFVVVVAALNLVLDFDFIEQGAAHRAPKYMEWYGAFGLLLTLVWLYLEILRLLAKLSRRD